MNPKAIRAEEMFGETDRLSGEVRLDTSIYLYHDSSATTTAATTTNYYYNT